MKVCSRREIKNYRTQFLLCLQAGYYIGKSCRLVLCVQKMEAETIIGGEKVSEDWIIIFFYVFFSKEVC